MADVRQRIRAFLGQFFAEGDLLDDENFFAAGHVNSLFVMQLVLFVESEFGLAVLDEDLEMENFSSVKALAALVTRKSGVAAG